MKKFTITNGENQKINVDLVRYFKFKNDLFLIYTMNEIDEKNYIKLYLVRIMEELGFPVVQTIRNDADWASMQGIVKKVLKEIKSGKRKQLEDLDYSDIIGIKVVNPRYFKLEQKLAEILSSNYLENESFVNNDNDINESNDIFEIAKSTTYEENDNDIALSESINNDQELTPLESIDATIEKEGKFEPKLDKNTLLDSNINQVNLINDETNVENLNNSVDNNIDENQININDVNESLNTIEETSNVTIEPIQENTTPLSNDNDQNINEMNEEVEEIDYKSLYMAVKKENESSSALIDNLMIQLQKYQEKYGTLEEES